jgi:hypothetical protein
MTEPGRAPLARCRCGGVWHDDDDGRHAHRVVFGHEPRPPPEPAKPEPGVPAEPEPDAEPGEPAD